MSLNSAGHLGPLAQCVFQRLSGVVRDLWARLAHVSAPVCEQKSRTQIAANDLEGIAQKIEIS